MACWQELVSRLCEKTWRQRVQSTGLAVITKLVGVTRIPCTGSRFDLFSFDIRCKTFLTDNLFHCVRSFHLQQSWIDLISWDLKPDTEVQTKMMMVYTMWSSMASHQGRKARSAWVRPREESKAEPMAAIFHCSCLPVPLWQIAQFKIRTKMLINCLFVNAAPEKNQNQNRF